jgi:hypothetical protein
MGAAFYCVCDARYFLGAVAMVNSLRLQGHTEPIFVLDCGLAPAQRELLEGEARIVASEGDAPPWLAKTIAPLAHPAEVMVLIDADMIVTRPLAGLIEEAREGRIVAFRDPQQRFFSEWGDLPGLGEPRRGPYVSSGLVVLPSAPGAEVLSLLHELRGQVDFEQTFWRRGVRDYPYLYADQDVLNAILATRVEAERLVARERRLAATPPFRNLRRLDGKRPRCAYPDGTEPFVVHQFVRKPWLERVYHGVYSRLLVRLLLEPDVAIRVPEHQVPLRLRRGVAASVGRALVNVGDLGRWYVGDRLPSWLGTRLEDARRRRAARRA